MTHLLFIIMSFTWTPTIRFTNRLLCCSCCFTSINTQTLHYQMIYSSIWHNLSQGYFYRYSTMRAWSCCYLWRKTRYLWRKIWRGIKNSMFSFWLWIWFRQRIIINIPNFIISYRITRIRRIGCRNFRKTICNINPFRLLHISATLPLLIKFVFMVVTSWTIKIDPIKGRQFV